MITPTEISKLRQNIDRNLLKTLPRGQNDLRKVLEHALAKGGKRFRPLLVLLASRAFGLNDDRPLHVATAIELVHNFTLVHDDIMDEQSRRRGQLTVQGRWGRDIAILAGDALFASSLACLARAGANGQLLELFAQRSHQICLGQMADISVSADWTAKRYFRMIDEKTGALFGLALESAAILAEQPGKIRKNYARAGLLLGRAYQLADDYREFFSTRIVEGKNLDRDFTLQRKSFALICAREANKRQFFVIQKLAGTDAKRAYTNLRKFMQAENIESTIRARIRREYNSAFSLLRRVDGDADVLLDFLESYFKPALLPATDR